MINLCTAVLPLWICEFDLLFWAWAFVTVIFFFTITIKVIPYFDKFIIGALWVVLLVMLIAREATAGILNVKEFVMNPGTLTFIAVIIGLIIYSIIRRDK